MTHVFICCFLTAHSLRSFKAQRSLSYYFFFLSAERAERKKQHPFGKFLLNNCLLASIHMHCMLAIIAPPEADYFSFAARSAANEKNIFLCDLCGSSSRRFLRGRAVNAF
jgi:hypothetical protein